MNKDYPKPLAEEKSHNRKPARFIEKKNKSNKVRRDDMDKRKRRTK